MFYPPQSLYVFGRYIGRVHAVNFYVFPFNVDMFILSRQFLLRYAPTDGVESICQINLSLTQATIQKSSDITLSLLLPSIPRSQPLKK